MSRGDHGLRSSFVAVFAKEFLHIRRDRGTLVAALTIPLFQLMLFGFIDQTVRDLPTVVADQDRSPESRLLVDQLRATRTFAVTRLTTDPAEARREMVAGTARVALLIPPNFHDRCGDGRPAQVGVLIDGSDSNASAQALASINGLSAARNQRGFSGTSPMMSQSNLARPREPPRGPIFSVQPVILFNPSGRTANYLIPGLVVILLQIVSMVLAAVAIVRERERGTMEQLLVTPVHPLGLMMGKLAPYLCLSLAEMAAVLAAMRFAFEVPIRGSLLFLFVMATVYLFALLSMGLFISNRAATQAQAQQQAQLLFLPSVFLSGYIFPVSGLPWPLYAVGRLLPATHMIEIMRGVVLRGASPADLWRSVLALFVMGVVLVWLSVRRFRKVAL